MMPRVARAGHGKSDVMAGKAKRKTLPKDFEQLLETGDLARLHAVFESCDVDARGGYSKQTALAFDRCPDDLARWLVSRGAQLAAVDTWGSTPLHSRARSWRSSIAMLLELGADVHAGSLRAGTPLHSAAGGKHAEHARQLLARGARVDARDAEGVTPLEVALSSCTNAELHRMPSFVRVLLEAGATRTPAMREFVKRLGKTFELHREGFNAEGVEEASAALDFLYATFEVTPVPRRRVHDGTAPIVVQARTWQEQHAELWELLVPSSGPARTVQGEIIRISGRISDEWERNGGINWDRDYEGMARALAGHLRRGTPLGAAEIAEVDALVRGLAQRDGEGNDRLAVLAVAWVLQNPQPMALEKPDYRR
jgi:hypothetical protein